MIHKIFPELKAVIGINLKHKAHDDYKRNKIIVYPNRCITQKRLQYNGTSKYNKNTSRCFNRSSSYFFKWHKPYNFIFDSR